METEYPSQVDACAVVLFSAPPLVVAAGVLTLTQSVGAGIVAIVTGLFVGGVIAALSIPCRYALADDILKIKSGLLEDEVPLRRIRRGEKFNGIWIAPALSLRRVKITLDDGSRAISPKDRDAFIADLEARLRHASKG